MGCRAWPRPSRRHLRCHRTSTGPRGKGYGMERRRAKGLVSPETSSAAGTRSDRPLQGDSPCPQHARRRASCDMVPQSICGAPAAAGAGSCGQWHAEAAKQDKCGTGRSAAEAPRRLAEHAGLSPGCWSRRPGVSGKQLTRSCLLRGGAASLFSASRLVAGGTARRGSCCAP